MESKPNKTRPVGIDAIFQYAGSGVQFFAGMLFYIIIVRIFDPSDVGAIALFIAIIGLFNIIFSLGLGTAAQHFTSYSVGRGDYNAAAKVFHKIIIYGFFVATVGFLSLIFLSPEVSILFFHSDKYNEIVKFLSIVLFGNILFGILNGVLLGLQDFKLSAIINIAIWIIYYLGSILLVYFVHELIIIILGWSIGVFIGVIIQLVSILKLISKFEKKGLDMPSYTLIKYSLPFLFSGLISYGAAYSDRFIVASLLNLSSLGVYNFALLIASSIGFFSTPFNNILMPKFSEMNGEGRKQDIAKHVKASSLLLSTIYVPSALGLSALSPIVLSVLGGPQYVLVSEPLSIIMFFSAAFISQHVIAQAIASIRRNNAFVYSSIIALSWNILLSLFLIPIYHLMGAAIAFSSVYLSTFIILTIFAVKEGVFGYDILSNIKIWISAVMMFLIIMLAVRFVGNSSLYLPIYIMLGFVVYRILSYFLKVFKNENREVIISIFPKKFKTLLFIFFLN